MADESKRPVESQPEAPTPIDPENPPEAIEEIEDKTIRELRAEPVPEEEMPDVAQEVEANLSDDAKRARAQTEAALDKPIEAIEDIINATDREDSPKTPAHELPSTHGYNETVVMGRVIPLPLYTVVFITLGVITLLELAIAELFPDGWLSTLLLIGLSIGKAVLVVLFYMHLREDSRMFALALILPTLVALVAALFLLSVPTTGY